MKGAIRTPHASRVSASVAPWTVGAAARAQLVRRAVPGAAHLARGAVAVGGAGGRLFAVPEPADLRLSAVRVCGAPVPAVRVDAVVVERAVGRGAALARRGVAADAGLARLARGALGVGAAREVALRVDAVAPRPAVRAVVALGPGGAGVGGRRPGVRPRPRRAVPVLADHPGAAVADLPADLRAHAVDAGAVPRAVLRQRAPAAAVRRRILPAEPAEAVLVGVAVGVVAADRVADVVDARGLAPAVGVRVARASGLARPRRAGAVEVALVRRAAAVARVPQPVVRIAVHVDASSNETCGEQRSQQRQ